MKFECLRKSPKIDLGSAKLLTLAQELKHKEELPLPLFCVMIAGLTLSLCLYSSRLSAGEGISSELEKPLEGVGNTKCCAIIPFQVLHIE